jgi:hypothetical protein
VCCFLGPLLFDWGPGYVRRSFFRPLAFQFPVDGVGGGLSTCSFCFCFASCFSSVSMKLGHFMFVVTVLRIAVCVSNAIFETVV